MFWHQTVDCLIAIPIIITSVWVTLHKINRMATDVRYEYITTAEESLVHAISFLYASKIIFRILSEYSSEASIIATGATILCCLYHFSVGLYPTGSPKPLLAVKYACAGIALGLVTVLALVPSSPTHPENKYFHFYYISAWAYYTSTGLSVMVTMVVAYNLFTHT